MASDAHAHPFDLHTIDADAEKERRSVGVSAAASAWREEEFLFHETLSQKARQDLASPLICCFGIHPQLPATDSAALASSLSFLHRALAEGRVGAIGEIGFDLYGPQFKDTERVQDDLFREQLDLANAHGLPVVLHLRKAMHKAFSWSRALARLPAVIFHSYSGTKAEAEAMLDRGVNGFFSFGTTVLLNHKQAMSVCATLPSSRLLVETDAPYQALRGQDHSSWRDLPLVLGAIADLRSASGSEGAEVASLEEITDDNFRRAYGLA